MGPTKLATEAGDIRAIAELVQRTWSFDSQWHIGDVAWGPGQWLDRDDWPMALWMGAAGRTDAWGWVEQPETRYLVVDPARADLVEDVLVWFEDVALGPRLSVTVLEHEGHVIRGLEDRGYERGRTPFFLHLRRELTDLPLPEAPEGFMARPITPDDLPERVRVHRAAWEPSLLTEASYRRVTECWPYRGDLDWVVEHRGTFVAYCLAWFDEATPLANLNPSERTHGSDGWGWAESCASLRCTRSVDTGAQRDRVRKRRQRVSDPGSDVSGPGLRTVRTNLDLPPVGARLRNVNLLPGSVASGG